MSPPFILTLHIRRLRLAIAFLVVLAILALTALEKVQAPGSDTSFPLLGRIVVIDPGHGGIDPGCHLGDVTEKEISLAVAFLLAEELRSLGGEAYLTRTADVELSPYGRTQRTRHGRDLEGRVLLAESHQGDVLVSLHVNAASSQRMNGGMVFYHPHSPESRHLAASVLEYLKDVTPGNQNASLAGDFFVLRRSTMPAVLVEMGFLTHPQDRAVLLSPEGKKRLAEAIARGVEAYFGGSQELVEESLAPHRAQDLSVYGLGAEGGHECPVT